MDGTQFDHLARTLSSCRSRRQALGLLAAVGLTGLPARRAWAAQDAAPPPSCPVGLTYCEGSGCVDLQADLENCGACGSVCQSGLVAVDCRNGECVRADCPPGLEYCGAVDLCRNLSVDPEHCGACGNACASGVCIDGACAADGGDGCAEGQTNCGGVCVETCCDNANCGACGIACPSGMTCFEGVCDCPSGLCGPVQLPNTGSGDTASGSESAERAAAAAAAAAALAALWRRLAVSGTIIDHAIPRRDDRRHPLG